MALDGPIVFGSFALALATILVCSSRTGITRSDLTKKLGPLNWDFSKGWAAGFTILLAILSPLASGSKNFVPDPTAFLPKPASYGALSLAFGVIVVLGPFLYRAWSEPAVKRGQDPEYQGYAVSFLVSTILTLWGTLGQLTTAFFMVLEAEPEVVGTHAAYLLVIPFLVAGVSMLVYVYRAMAATISTYRAYETALATDSSAQPPGVPVL